MKHFQPDSADQAKNIVLFGPHGVAKTTIYRHLLWNYGNGKELVKREGKVKEHVRLVLNIHKKFMKSVVERFGTTGNDLHDKNIKKANNWNIYNLTQEYSTFVHELWMSARGQEVWNNRDKYGISDSLGYLCQKDTLQRMLRSDYEITFQDFIREPYVSTEVYNNDLLFKKHQMRIFDIGGQGSDWNKWRSLIVDTSAIIYVAALDDFTKTLWEDDVDLFSRLLRFRALNHTPVIVLLTKLNAFQKKLKEMEQEGENLDQYFPELALGTNYETASVELIGFMEHQLKAVIPDQNKHMICFLNSTNVEETARTLENCFDWLQSVTSNREI